MAAPTPFNNATLQGLVEKNRKAGRLQAPEPKAVEPKRVLVGLRLPPEEADQARALAAAEERSVAVFLRRIYLRGLQAYLQEQGTH